MIIYINSNNWNYYMLGLYKFYTRIYEFNKFNVTCDIFAKYNWVHKDMFIFEW